MIVDDDGLRKILKSRCKEAGSQRAWARRNGLEEAVVSRVINGERGFTDQMLKALKAREIKNYKVTEMHFKDIG